MFVVIKKHKCASYEFPYSAFLFDTLEEAQEFRKECLTYTEESLQLVRNMDNPNATEDEVRYYVENQKIGIISYEEYEALCNLYLAADPSSEERLRIINHLDTKINNFDKEVK